MTMRASYAASLSLLLLLAGCGDDSGGGETESSTSASVSATESTSATEGPATTTASATAGPTSAGPTSGPSSETGASTETSTGEPTEEPIDGCVVVVDGQSGDDLFSGASWLLAKRTVNAAIERAAEIMDPDEGCAVWVAEGVYTPSEELDTSASFVLQPKVALYGGFAGDEGSLAERDWEAHETVLSGELGDPEDPGDNARHVVLSADGARVDGFTITGGVTGEEIGMREGAGILGTEGALTVANCVVTGNVTGRGGDGEVGTIGGGGGLGAGIYFSGESLTLLDSVISENLGGPGGDGAAIGGTGGEGAGVAFFGGALTVRGVVFDSNRGGDGGVGGDIGGPGGSGAALFVRATTSVVIEDSEFTNNLGGTGGTSGNLNGFGGGSALLISGEPAVVINRCLVRDNQAGEGGGGADAPGSFAGMGYTSYQGSGGLVVANSRFEGNGDGFGGGLGVVAEAMAPAPAVLFVNTVIAGNVSSGQSGGVYLRSNGNQAVTFANCSIAGNDAEFSGAGLLFASPQAAGPEPTRLVNSIVWGNTAGNNPNLEAIPFGFDIVDPVQLEVISSSIEGGCAPTELVTCTNALSDSPQFVDLGAGDLQLGPGSALIDAGDDGLLPPDLADLDGDGDVDEPTPLDLDELPRIAGAAVDLGALERP